MNVFPLVRLLDFPHNARFGVVVVDLDAFEFQGLPAGCSLRVAVLVDELALGDQLAAVLQVDAVGEEPELAVAEVQVSDVGAGGVHGIKFSIDGEKPSAVLSRSFIIRIFTLNQLLMITDINQLDFNKRYNYADYLTWQFDDMVELIRGKVFRMSPAPSTSHQHLSGNLFSIIHQYLKGKPCQVFAAPFDVRLPLPPGQQTAEQIDTVVQPDISIICDPEKLDERGCQGAPDWIIEILSKSTAAKDLTEKYALYEHAGVREYWVAHPNEGTLLIYRLDEAGRYQLLRQTPFVKGEKAPSAIFPDLEIDLDEVFGD